MNEEKSTPDSVAEEIDYSGRPFGYKDAINETAMIWRKRFCHQAKDKQHIKIT